jgi:predicted nucleic acid-binding Zn ribbon protein/uncharacterized protein YlaI
MPYIPRPVTTEHCANCGQPFESRNLRRKYCCNSCNVLASYERNGRQSELQPTKADLQAVVVAMTRLLESTAPKTQTVTKAKKLANKPESKTELEEAKERFAELAVQRAKSREVGAKPKRLVSEPEPRFSLEEARKKLTELARESARIKESEKRIRR